MSMMKAEFLITVGFIWVITVIGLLIMGIRGEMWISAIGILASTGLCGYFLLTT